MSTAWWIKAAPRRKGSIGKRKFRWDVLGLQDPAVTASTPSIEDIRRQIKSAASYGLSAETLMRSREKDERPKPGSRVSGVSRKRGASQ